jgi:hypothetical protein
VDYDGPELFLQLQRSRDYGHSQPPIDLGTKREKISGPSEKGLIVMRVAE